MPITPASTAWTNCRRKPTRAASGELDRAEGPSPPTRRLPRRARAALPRRPHLPGNGRRPGRAVKHRRDATLSRQEDAGPVSSSPPVERGKEEPPMVASGKKSQAYASLTAPLSSDAEAGSLSITCTIAPFARRASPRPSGWRRFWRGALTPVPAPAGFAAGWPRRSPPSGRQRRPRFVFPSLSCRRRLLVTALPASCWRSAGLRRRRPRGGAGRGAAGAVLRPGDGHQRRG